MMLKQCNLGNFYEKGQFGLPQSRVKALELWNRAAELGHAPAYYNLGSSYEIGRGVGIDEKKAKHFYELAAMKGNVLARNFLGFFELGEGNVERALKHFMFAIAGGCAGTLREIRLEYMSTANTIEEGHRRITKEAFEKAMRAYQTYLDEIKSPQRDEAAA